MNYTDCLTKTQAEIDERFSVNKSRTLYLSKIYREIGLLDRSDTVRDCGTYLKYSLGPLGPRLVDANFCKDRLCPMCNWRRSKKFFSQVSACMDFLEKNGCRFLFLTLTSKNCSACDLSSTLDWLSKSWTRFYRATVLKKFVLGAFRSLELTYNHEKDTFHPHFHCILCVRSDYFENFYLEHAKWCEIWQKALDVDYLPSVRIMAVKNGKYRVETVNGVKYYSRRKAQNEVSKYCVKPSDYLKGNPWDALVVSAFADVLKGRRLYGFIGSFLDARNALRLDGDEDGGLVHFNDKLRPDVEFAVVTFKWFDDSYLRFVKKTFIDPFDDSACVSKYDMGFVV